MEAGSRPLAAESRRSLGVARLVAHLGVCVLALTASADPLSESIRARVEALTATVEHGGEVRVASATLGARRTLPGLYERVGWRPLWRDRAQIDSMRGALATLEDDGLPLDAYHLDALARATGDDLDLLATDAFLLAGAHLVGGRVAPSTFDRNWHAQNREVDLEALLIATLEGSGTTRRIGDALTSLRPRDPAYERLRAAHARLRPVVAAGGWPALDEATFPVAPTLEPGADDPRVPRLRERLLASGDLTAADAEPAAPSLYDDALRAAVERFQERHGLEADAKVGPKTLAALRTSAEDRLRQLELDLERWRWLPRELLGDEPGSRAVRVNIAGYDLELLRRTDDGGREVQLAMRVIVGREGRETPVFSDSIRYLVLNPSWNVPTSLATRDKLPMAKKDPEFFQREGYEIFDGYGEGAAAIDPSSVDWQSLPGGSFPYRLRQRPGPANALGKVKFMFPNRFNIYLHDTPGRTLFARAQRDFSSGCIRVEKPLELTEALLGPEWPRERIDAALATGREQTVMLPTPVPVHLLHWTTWVDDDGTLHVRPDLYGRNARLDAALRQADAATSP